MAHSEGIDWAPLSALSLRLKFLLLGDASARPRSRFAHCHAAQMTPWVTDQLPRRGHRRSDHLCVLEGHDSPASVDSVH